MGFSGVCCVKGVLQKARLQRLTAQHLLNLKDYVAGSGLGDDNFDGCRRFGRQGSEFL